MTWIAEIRSDYFDECDGRFKFTRNENYSFTNISQVYDRMQVLKDKAYKKCRTVDSKIMKITQA
jgi:hypothetical protein